MLNSVLHSTPVCQTFRGEAWCWAWETENLLPGSSVRRRTRKPHVLCCKWSDQQVHRHLGTQVHSGQEDRKVRKERCQAHLGLEVSLKSQEDHLAGEGVDGGVWQQEWHRKKSQGVADAQFTNLCCAVTGSHRGI